MDITLLPGKLAGTLTVPPSKSVAHRMLICAAFASTETVIYCPKRNADLEATVDCLNALGAQIRRSEDALHVTPIRTYPSQATLFCRESGSTLRFLLPIVGALGIPVTFHMDGRLPQRPLSPLWEEMQRMGCQLTRPTENTVFCTGRLQPGIYRIDGSVSSQFITGLEFALPLMEEQSVLQISGMLQSKPYLDITASVKELFHYPHAPSPGKVSVEGDWSSAAFWLAANAMGSQIHVQGLNAASVQGDRSIAQLLSTLKDNCTISAADIPDLIPILAVVAAAQKGAVFTHIQRLRLKESDRVAAIVAMLQALGGKAQATESSLTVCGTGLLGGTVDSFGDHRIAMAACIASTVCSQPVTVLGAECVNKSYPAFWAEFSRLGGKYEQYLR